MTDKEFLDSPILQTPIVRNKEDFSIFIRFFLQSYMATLRVLKGDLKEQINPRIPIIQELCNGLIQSIELYYLGAIHAAYDSFHKAIAGVKDYLWLDSNVTVYLDQNLENLIAENLFKVRAGGTRPYSKSEMFIRPFEQREFINTYRYSIPGLPCLYLSANTFTAWNELDCPDINTLQISRFILDKTLKKLRFGFNIYFWKTSVDAYVEMREKLYDFITYFPLYAVCNIKVKNANASFKPEYVFPQFLMQWVQQEHQIDIVEYSSTKIDYSKNAPNGQSYQFRNLAIPAQTIAESGHCTYLQQRIQLTEPVSWRGLTATYPNQIFAVKKPFGNTNFHRIFRDILQIEMITGKPTLYGQTIFGQLEDYIIDQMEANYLHQTQ